MEEESKSLQDYLKIIKRHQKAMMLTFLILFTLMAIIALKLPAVYKSTATILIEQQEIPKDLVRSTITSFADQRIQVISQRVMTSENIKAIFDKFNLYSEERRKETLESLFEKFRKDLQLEMVSADVVDPQSGRPTQATIAFTITYNSVSPQLAQQVANEMVSLYLNENLKRRNLAASEATDFLTIEANKLREHIADLENQLASFKENNSNALPEFQQLNIQLMDRTEQELSKLDQQANSLNDRKLYLEAELAQLQPNLSSFTATGERIYGASDRLKALQAEYVALTAKYAPTHPDIIKMEKEISALESESGEVDQIEIVHHINEKKGELAQLSERYTPEHPDVIKLKKTIERLEEKLNQPAKTKKSPAKDTKPDNPAYIQLQAQLQATTAELNSLSANKSSLKSRAMELEKNLRAAPQVERKYHDLTREYENATAKYREIKAKQMEADMSKAMEKDSRSEHFSLIEPPLFPEKPYKPNRPAIFLLGLILSLGSALGYGLVKSSMDQGIYGAKEIQSITGYAPLITIPYIKNSEDVQQHSRNKRLMIGGSISILIVFTLIIHFLYAPLDVLWYTIARKIN